MTDLAKLREALEGFQTDIDFMQMIAPAEGLMERTHRMLRVLAAARAYADLLENGPTDEMVERAAEEMWLLDNKRSWNRAKGNERANYLYDANLVLTAALSAALHGGEK
jgi:hypothetical protein